MTRKSFSPWGRRIDRENFQIPDSIETIVAPAEADSGEPLIRPRSDDEIESGTLDGSGKNFVFFKEVNSPARHDFCNSSPSYWFCFLLVIFATALALVSFWSRQTAIEGYAREDRAKLEAKLDKLQSELAYTQFEQKHQQEKDTKLINQLKQQASASVEAGSSSIKTIGRTKENTIQTIQPESDSRELEARYQSRASSIATLAQLQLSQIAYGEQLLSQGNIVAAKQILMQANPGYVYEYQYKWLVHPVYGQYWGVVWVKYPSGTPANYNYDIRLW